MRVNGIHPGLRSECFHGAGPATPSTFPWETADLYNISGREKLLQVFDGNGEQQIGFPVVQPP